MTIIESLSRGKNPTVPSEDAIVATDDYVAVIDGSTSKSLRRLRSDMTNGRLASTTIATFIEQMPSNLDCAQFCLEVTRHISQFYTTLGIDRQTLLTHAENRMTASAIIYSVSRKEIWMVGDCQCLVNGVPYTNEKPTEKANALRRSALLHQALEEGHTTIDCLRHDDIGRAAILPDIIQSTRRQNIDFAVIDGYPIAMDYVRVLFVPVAEEIVLASDGYPKLFNDLASTEAYLEQVIREDPLFISLHPATKGVMDGNGSNDDRSYIRFMV